MSSSLGQPEPATHEIRGNVLYTDFGDSPYWAIDKMIEAVEGGEKGIWIDVDGETWEVSVGYQWSGLEPRKSDEVSRLKEFRVNAAPVAEDDRRNLPLLIQPRLDWGEERRPNSVPNDLGLATNVRVETSANMGPAEIEEILPKLFRQLASEIGISWNGDYFTGRPHDYSTIIQFEIYYRLLREIAKKIVRSDGVMRRLFELVANVEGSKIVYSADNREIVGYNHQVRIDRDGVNELFPDRLRPGFQAKHYHPQHVRKKTESDPLYHPKFGVLFKKSWNNDTGWRWNDHRELRDELEEILVNLLRWGDVPITGGNTFVTDDHFDASVPSETDVALYDDPTPAIETSQDSILLSTLTRLSDRDVDVVERVAMADGGEVAVDEISESTGWATRTVYRALSKLGDLLSNDNGNVRFISSRIRDRVQELLDELDRQVDAKLKVIEDTLNVNAKDLERAGTAWQNWLRRYGAEFIESEKPTDDPTIRIREMLAKMKSFSGEYEHVSEVLQYGLVAWRKAGRDGTEYVDARVEYETPMGKKQDSVRYLIEDVETG